MISESLNILLLAPTLKFIIYKKYVSSAARLAILHGLSNMQLKFFRMHPLLKRHILFYSNGLAI